MANWASSMQQTFEFYVVDPGTWGDESRLDNVKSCTINRDADAETLGSATIDVTESVGECYIRVYIVLIQNGVTEKHPIGTFLVQTPSSSYDGKIRNVSMDAYTPLIELKESLPPLGYSMFKKENIMDRVCALTAEHARAPVVDTTNSKNLEFDFIANTDDTWLSFLSDLMKIAKYEYQLDEHGRILFAPIQDTSSLQPVWTYTDDNSSILYPEFSIDHDLYGVPNVVEVSYSHGDGSYYARVVNDDEDSPISTVNRGREIVHRITDPDMNGNPSKAEIKEYAERVLKELSTIEYTVSYTHGYCPVRLGDCVRLDYNHAGLNNVKAKVVSQSIKCVPGCPVTEKAVFSKNLWR